MSRGSYWVTRQSKEGICNRVKNDYEFFIAVGEKGKAKEAVERGKREGCPWAESTGLSGYRRSRRSRRTRRSRR